MLRKTAFGIVLTLLLIAMFTSAFDVHVQTLNSSSVAANVYVDPSTSTFYTNTTSVGDHFTISVKVSNVVDLSVWQVKLYFNSTQIEATKAWIPKTDPTYVFYGKTTAMPTPVINNVTGYVLIGDSIILGSTFNGSGLLAKIEFEIMMAPPPNATISCTLNINNSGTFLLDSAMMGIICTKTNGLYQYAYVARGPFPMLDDLYFVSAYPDDVAVSKALACQLDVVMNLGDVYASELEENGWAIEEVDKGKSYYSVLLKFFKFPGMAKFNKTYVDGMVKKANGIYNCTCDTDVQFRWDGTVREIASELNDTKLLENLRKQPNCTKGINVVFVPGDYPGDWNGVTIFKPCGGVKDTPNGGVKIRDTCNQTRMGITLAHELMHALGLSHEIQRYNDPTLKSPPHGRGVDSDGDGYSDGWDVDGDGDVDAKDKEQLLWGCKDRTNTKITRQQCEYMAKNAKETPCTESKRPETPIPPPASPGIPPSSSGPFLPWDPMNPFGRPPWDPVYPYLRPEPKSNVTFDVLDDVYLNHVDLYGVIGINYYDPDIGTSTLTLEVEAPIPNNTIVHYGFYLNTDDDNSTGSPGAPLPGADFYAVLHVVGTSQSAELRKYVSGSWTYVQSLEWKITTGAEDYIHEDYGGENDTGYLVTLYVPLDKLELAEHGNMQVLAFAFDFEELVIDTCPVLPISLEVEISPLAYSYPSYTSAGKIVNVYGIGFSPNTTVSIEFDWTLVATGNVGPSGCFAANFTVPSVVVGVYQVNVADSHGKTDTFMLPVDWIPVKRYYYAFKPGLNYFPESLNYDNNWMYGLLYWDNASKTSANIHVPGPIQSLNPGWARSAYEWQVLNRLYDRLIAVDPITNEDIPWAAKSWKVDLWSSPGEGVQYGQKINFKLQTGIMWHDGTPVDASTIKWNWDFIANIKMPAYYEVWKDYIRTEIVNQFEVNVYVNSTNPWILYDLAGTALLFPPHIWNKFWGDPNGAKNFKPWETGELIGTGPWVFKGWDTVANKTHVTANKIYWGHGRALAVASVTPSETVVSQGCNTNIKVTLENQGDFVEDFNVTVYAGNLPIGEQQVTLNSKESMNVTFTWDTTSFDKGNYTIWAHVWLVPGEIEIADNTFSDSWVVVTIPGDINGDFKVDIKDLVLVIKYYATYPGHPNWNPNADVNNDGKVDIKDLVLVIKHFAEHYP